MGDSSPGVVHYAGCVRVLLLHRDKPLQYSLPRLARNSHRFVPPLPAPNQDLKRSRSSSVHPRLYLSPIQLVVIRNIQQQQYIKSFA